MTEQEFNMILGIIQDFSIDIETNPKGYQRVPWIELIQKIIDFYESQ